ncbi:Cationic amino acid transporter [Saccharomyces pastorianus]|nr:Cationic amino acid transporter [Saccharomyces pastorianus]
MQLVPVELNGSTLSGISGSISISCWIIVFVPQIYENFYRKSSDGLSLLFVILWLAGDVFNLMGAVLQNLLSTMIILAAYYTVADVILLGQCLWYDNEEKPAVDPIHLSPANPMNENVLHDVFNEQQPLLNTQGQANHIDEEMATPSSNGDVAGDDLRKANSRNFVKDVCIVAGVVFVGVVSWYVTYCLNYTQSPPVENLPLPVPELEINWLAQIFGYLSAMLYLGSRIPQILLNFKRKSCEGISFLFFLFACLGNITFIFSVVVISLDWKYLILNASWLVGSIGTLFMDFVIFSQFFIYKGNKRFILN